MPSSITADRTPAPAAGYRDLPDLLAAYLTAVAEQLAEDGIVVRALRVDETDRHGGPALAATLTLVPTGADRWVPDCLRWDEHAGWSARLRHPDEPALGTVSRHLTGQIVPAPRIVAHFALELDQDPNTIWASALEQHPVPLDRRRLALELDGYAYP